MHFFIGDHCPLTPFILALWTSSYPLYKSLNTVNECVEQHWLIQASSPFPFLFLSLFVSHAHWLIVGWWYLEIELTLLLCEEQALTMEDLEKRLDEHGFSNVIHPKVVPVPKHAPLNRTQFEAWKQVWPLTYREDTRQDPKFTSDDIKVIQQHMREILQSDDVMRARIVDPVKKRIIAEAQDTRQASSHPLHHAVMNCVGAVADAEKIAATDSSSSMGRPKRKASQVAEEESNSVYLCTGYDIYLTHEPCAM